MALILSGDTGVPASGMPTGSVIQTVNVVYTTAVNTTSTSFVDSGLQATITPISASNKILVVATLAGIYINNTGNYLIAQILSGSTGVVTNFTGAGSAYNGNNGGTGGSASVTYLDSPATASPITYKIQYKSATSSQAVYINNGGSPASTITLLEIKQ